MLPFINIDKDLTCCLVSSSLLIIPYQSLEYVSKDETIARSGFSISKFAKSNPWVEFDRGVSWTPQRLEVNGRKGRRAVCVLAEDLFHYRVYDLDARSEAQMHEGALVRTSE